ncbi:hypothetical protein FPQ18DRAFT_336168 [Pyronema domesticum]|uniref:Similar to Hydroxyacyl-thioester dehydratase type 2, mitochondrial acc. no. Q9Y814 n=1 Tax=Pyronema omphalodes (strain CBS 100304) TaxID=1076935 RepID=U4L0S1_PYROM|nr:hypothetical protein FPQ18DRAFT_336168 [Pyronema domesticum]CCX05644.1 Similar to Hydroxyacyl-thioester dehydratase type 2, mitochondrial; acc. no. Q9Y814 [Pyronema omphalodes CBS 100304]
MYFLRALPRALPRTPARCLSTSVPRFTTSSPVTPEQCAAAANTLLTRQLPHIPDWLSPQQSHLLSLTLSPYLKTDIPRSSPRTSGPIPAGHHLIYFPPQLPESLLLPDGSDLEQSPGEPWTRRMWAGGRLDFDVSNPLLIGDEAVLKERIEDVKIRGDKLFCSFERAMFRRGAWVQGTQGQESEKPSLVETRTLVFFPTGPHQQAARQLPVKETAEFGETFETTEHLLFRFSALTWNAHKIHLDKEFSRDKEGYRGLLCHGPLAVAMLMGLLERELAGAKRVKSFEYRCLAPLFVGETYKIAGKWKGDDKVELWCETPEGGFAVRGMAEVV